MNGKGCGIYTMNYYSTINKNGIIPYAYMNAYMDGPRDDHIT